MSRLIGFYGTQLRVLWEWRGGRLGPLRRLLLTFAVAIVSFLVTAWLMPRLTVDGFSSAALAVDPDRRCSTPPSARSSSPSPRRSRSSWSASSSSSSRSSRSSSSPSGRRASTSTASGPRSIASFVYAIVNTILTAILGVDRGGSYYGLLVQRLLVQRSQGHTDKPGLVIVQIDGLAHPILAGRMRAGSVNTMAGMVRDGSHKLSKWEAILPSMTSGSQAGILHGNNDGIPAFRWYERDRQHLMASSNPGRRDARSCRASRTARACSRTTAPASATC